MDKRVLIVDDALIMRKKIREIAERAGWQVAAEARDGREAVELFQREKPDLVTLDIVMPHVDGLTALKRIMAVAPGARVVMVSAVDQREKLAECIESGALDFIVKPFDELRLLSLFAKYLPGGR